MKKIFIYSAMAAVLALGNTSCSDFLEVKPAGSVSEQDFVSAKGVEQLVTGMYAKMHDNSYFEATLSNYVYGDVMGGSANKGSTYQDQPDFTSLETYTFTTDNGYLNVKWKKCYNGVFVANNVIKLADMAKEEMSTVNGEAKDNYTETIAQARFFRAFWHFEVVKLFGAAVPYVDDLAMQENVNPQVSNVDESGNYIYIWDKIIDDLQFAYDNLPDRWTTDKGRINKWAAGALLAKVKMYQSSPYDGKNGSQNRWTEVKSLWRKSWRTVKTITAQNTNWLTHMRSFTSQVKPIGLASLYLISKWQSLVLWKKLPVSTDHGTSVLTVR